LSRARSSFGRFGSFTATKKKYSNSHVVRKKISERNNKTITPSPLQVKWSVPKYFADISNIENEPNLPNEDLARVPLLKISHFSQG
jgi:hypothetical protein